MSKFSAVLGLTAAALVLSACAGDHMRADRDTDRYSGTSTRYDYSDAWCPPALAHESKCYHPWYSSRLPHDPDALASASHYEVSGDGRVRGYRDRY